MKVVPLKPFREANPNVAFPHFIATRADVEDSTIMEVPEGVGAELIGKGVAADVTDGEDQELDEVNEDATKSDSETNPDDNAGDEKVKAGEQTNGWGNK